MAKTVIGLFESHASAVATIDDLKNAGLDRSDIKLLSGTDLDADDVKRKGAPSGLKGFLAKVDPKAFPDPGLPPDAPHVEEALRWAGPAAGMTLYLDRGDGTHGGSDYRDFARARVSFVRFFGNFFPEYHEPGDTPAGLDPAQVQRVARLALATAWRLADR